MLIVPACPVTLESHDDGQLAALAQAGDGAAFEVLVRRWQIPLLRFLHARVNYRADAEDLFRCRQIGGEGRLLSWVVSRKDGHAQPLAMELSRWSTCPMARAC